MFWKRCKLVGWNQFLLGEGWQSLFYLFMWRIHLFYLLNLSSKRSFYTFILFIKSVLKKVIVPKRLIKIVNQILANFIQTIFPQSKFRISGYWLGCSLVFGICIAFCCQTFCCLDTWILFNFKWKTFQQWKLSDNFKISLGHQSVMK